MKSRRIDEKRVVPALFRFLVIVLIIGSALFYGVGGWYFADVVQTDALELDPWTESADVHVTAASDDTVAFDATGHPEIRTDGWFGVRWADGAGLAGPVVESIGSNVVREFVLLDGDPIDAADLVVFDSWVWSDPEQGLGLPFETVAYESPLGSMDAWFIDADSEDWIIAVHGKGTDKREALRIASIANRAGMNSLLIDYRNDLGAPEDPSGIYQYGRTEWEDLEGAVEYALDQGAERIVLVGLSTGAAVSLAFLYQSDLAPEIDGAIFDSANIDMERTVRHGADQTDLPLVGIAVPHSLATAALWLAELRFDIDFEAVDYIAGADALSIPILLIHGDNDLTVPHSVSVDLATARSDLVTYEEFEGAGHVESWNVDRLRYTEVVLEFLTRDQ